MDIFDLAKNVTVAGKKTKEQDDADDDTATMIASHSFDCAAPRGTPEDVSLLFPQKNQHTAESNDDTDVDFQRSLSHNGAIFLPKPLDMSELVTHCNDVQREVLKIISQEAKKASDGALKQFIEKIKKVSAGPKISKYTEVHAMQLLRYIREEAPIIIHIPIEADGRADKLLADTHYRNQFETKLSRGTFDPKHGGQRWGWEKRLFHQKYDDVDAFLRPKYGCLNIVNDPRGISSASHYGDSYFILRGVRLRTTFTDMDSSCSNCKVATCEHYAHSMLSW
eukprot:PhF_6_TR1052/c0_g1_i3/m.2177